MKSTRLLFAFFLSITFLIATAASGSGIDMNDPRRALGREDDVRVDAQLVRDTVAPGAPIGVTYQIQNLSDQPVAVADRVADASYDTDTRTITLAIGSEVPDGGNLPHMIIIAPGEKKVLRTAATPVFNAQATRTAFAAVPRFVQVTVTILRDLAPFRALIDNQTHIAVPQRLSDQQFDQWFESSDTIFLNALPVQWSPRSVHSADVERRTARGGF